MAAFDFPSSPNNGDTYSANGIDWIYNGNVWKKDATAGVKGQKGEIGVGDKGQKGQKGEVGEKGDKGQKGEIGATGGTGGTGSKGQKGEVGATGATGAAAAKGQKGEIGATGGTGGTGSTGDKGQKGEASTVKGDKGQKGEIGVTGDKGSTGAGDKGQKGEEGPQGGGAPVGQIVAWSGSAGSLPTGYFLCDGSAVSRTTYAALFTVVGTTHGAGNGSTTFNIPDLRSRFVVGASSSGGYNVGNTGGSADATLVSHSHTINNHTHSFSGSGSSSHTHGVPRGRGGSQASISNYVPSPTVEQVQSPFNTTSATVNISISGDTGNPSDRGTNSQGSSATNANLPPYYALAYIIQFSQGGETAKGQKGETGSTGSTGSTGAKGQKGEAGDKGAASSVQGPTGDKGQKGEVGAQGSGGSTGTKGQKGEVGSTGSTGSTGSAGSDGDKGQKGEAGSTGSTGSTGAKGQKGEIGSTGSTGSTGSAGSDGDKGQKGEVGSQGQAAIVKHVRQTSNFVRPTGNTSYGVAGNMQISVTAPSNNCLLFFNYQFNLRTLSSSAEGVTYRGRVLVNGSFDHFFIGQSETGSSSINNHKDFESEGYSGSTYYSANDTITIQLEIRNKDTGTGNRTQLDAGSYMTVFVFETS